jgi:hypothetical protein
VELVDLEARCGVKNIPLIDVTCRQAVGWADMLDPLFLFSSRIQEPAIEYDYTITIVLEAFSSSWDDTFLRHTNRARTVPSFTLGT